MKIIHVKMLDPAATMTDANEFTEIFKEFFAQNPKLKEEYSYLITSVNYDISLERLDELIERLKQKQLELGINNQYIPDKTLRRT